MTELILKKRQGRAGEIGLFLDVPEAFDEEWSCLPMGAEIKAECTVPAHARYLKFWWAMCGLICDNCEAFVDKRDCSNRLLIEAGHYKRVQQPLTGVIEFKPKSVAGLSADAWVALLRAATNIVIENYLPDMSEGVLTGELAKMLGMNVFEEVR